MRKLAITFVICSVGLCYLLYQYSFYGAFYCTTPLAIIVVICGAGLGYKLMKVSKNHWVRLRILALVIICSVGLGYLLFHYGPLGDLYCTFNSDHIYKEAIKAVPEFDELNDALFESLPVYPEATLIPRTTKRTGPDRQEFGGVSGPRYLSSCFATNDSWEQVAIFYQNVLGEKSWKLVWDDQDIRSSIYGLRYAKDRACVDLRRDCRCPTPDGETVYEVIVYYDLGVLLPFPGLPKDGKWDGGIRRCPP